MEAFSNVGMHFHATTARCFVFEEKIWAATQLWKRLGECQGINYLIQSSTLLFSTLSG